MNRYPFASNPRRLPVPHDSPLPQTRRSFAFQWMPLLPLALLGVVLPATGCGGKAVIDPELETSTATGGQGAMTTTTTSSGAMGGGGSAGSGGTYVPPIDPLVEHALGQVGSGESRTFTAEDGLLGMTVLAEIPAEYSTVGIEEVIAPNDTAIVSDFIIEQSMWPFENYGLVAAAVPQSDHGEAMPVMPGDWTFRVDTSFTGSPVDLSVWTRQTVDGAFHGGVIDVNVFHVPSAASEQYLRGMVERAFGSWAGLGLGTLTFHELSEQFAIVDEYNAWDVFVRTSQAEGSPALNVMVVRDFGGELVGAGGFSVGQPGFPLRHGTLLSGVVMLTFDDDFDALVLRHEAGHLAGIYHTSEIEPGGYQDHLDDTPFCDDPWDQMESCPDYDNLMFPIAGSLAMQLSPKQQRIVQGSLLYRAIVQAGDPPVPPMDEGGVNDPDDPSGTGSPGADDGMASGAARAGLEAPLGAPTRPSEQPWAAGLPASLAAYLLGHWAPAFGGASPFAAAARLAEGDRELLWSIGLDERAPSRVRMRALITLGHLAPNAELRRRLARLGATRLAPGRVRIGALRALEAAGAPELDGLARALTADADSLVASVAKRQGAR